MDELKSCKTDVVAAWAIGGDDVRLSLRRWNEKTRISFRWRNSRKKPVMPLVKIREFDTSWFKCTTIIRKARQVNQLSVPLRVVSNCFSSDRTDSSGIRFYVNDRLRQYDLGYLQFGTESNAAALAIPPGVDQFIVDSYCSPKASQVNLDIIFSLVAENPSSESSSIGHYGGLCPSSHASSR